MKIIPKFFWNVSKKFVIKIEENLFFVVEYFCLKIYLVAETYNENFVKHIIKNKKFHFTTVCNPLKNEKKKIIICLTKFSL